MRRAPTAPQTNWPTPEQLEQMGLVPCQADGPCTVWVDPANVPSHKCARHQQQTRQPERPLAEIRFAPLPDYQDRPRRHRERAAA
jgi:hypothetical protein